MKAASMVRVPDVSMVNGSSRLTLWWFFPLFTGLVALALYSTFVVGFDADIWFNAVAPVVVPITLVGLGVLTPIVYFRVLQVLGVVGVVYVRAFSDGSALVGSWWRVRDGRGLALHRDSPVHVEVIETMPKTLGWRHDTGIPVYMGWTISSGKRSFSWLTPFDAAPDAADRIQAVLATLPEPTFESLATSQAAQAGGS